MLLRLMEAFLDQAWHGKLEASLLKSHLLQQYQVSSATRLDDLQELSRLRAASPFRQQELQTYVHVNVRRTNLC